MIPVLIPLALSAFLAIPPSPHRPLPPARITILYDAFGDRPALTPDWGFAALVEYRGHRILFDTGNDAAILAHNVRALAINLRQLDAVVISHRHGDHTSGLAYVLRLNPHVPVYAPRENFGAFGSMIPQGFYRTDTTLDRRQRYFAGRPPAPIRSGTPWRGTDFRWVDTVATIAPGFVLVGTVSRTPGTLELRELSLVITTPAGIVVIAGCSHPGIETILEAATAGGASVHEVVGGLHLVAAPDSAITRLVDALHDRWRVARMAPGHCTGEPAFALIARRFGADDLYAGLGTRLSIP